jgi:transketolase
VTLREGTDIAFIGTGFMTARCLEAAEVLAEKGISARVDHHPCLKPFDRDMVADAARACGAIVTAENHSIIGGLGSAVAEALVELYPVPMQRIGVNDKFVETGEIPDLFAKYRTRIEDIVRAAEEALRLKKQLSAASRRQAES